VGLGRAELHVGYEDGETPLRRCGQTSGVGDLQTNLDQRGGSSELAEKRGENMNARVAEEGRRRATATTCTTITGTAGTSRS
jgi:hypothetical protein